MNDVSLYLVLIQASLLARRRHTHVLAMIIKFSGHRYSGGFPSGTMAFPTVSVLSL